MEEETPLVRSFTEPRLDQQDLQAPHRNSAGFSPQVPGSPLSDFSPNNSDCGSLFGDDIILVSEVEGAEGSGPEEHAEGEYQVLPLIEKRKRGRRPIRPFDPVKKKTEEKDKYWLRAFRAYMKNNYGRMKKTMTADERFFWRDHLGADGKPEKGNRFLSYGKQYKKALFSNSSFVKHFQQWFLENGETELLKKCSRDSAIWFVFYDYGSKELFNYNPNCPSPPQDSGTDSPEDRGSPEPEDQPMMVNYDITMVDADGGVDNLLDSI